MELGAETMEDLFAAHRTSWRTACRARAVRLRALSVIDPTQAPPGKHTTYAWHVMPLDPDIGGKGIRELQGGVRRADHRDVRALLPEHDEQEHHRASTSTPAREYTQEILDMRGGDIFMGAFNAEQVMYNHFGYRTPIGRSVQGRLGRASRRRDLRRLRLYQRRHHRARSRPEAVVDAVGRPRGAGLIGTGGGLVQALPRYGAATHAACHARA